MARSARTQALYDRLYEQDAERQARLDELVIWFGILCWFVPTFWMTAPFLGELLTRGLY